MNQFLIDGELTGSIAGEQLEVENPSTGETFTTVPLGRPADASAAITFERVPP